MGCQILPAEKNLQSTNLKANFCHCVQSCYLKYGLINVVMKVLDKKIVSEGSNLIIDGLDFFMVLDKTHLMRGRHIRQ